MSRPPYNVHLFLKEKNIRDIITKILNGDDVSSIALKPKIKRDEILRYLREKEGFTIGQLERVTGISRGIITRSYNNVQKLACPQ